MSHISLSAIGDTPFEKLMGWSPKILKHWTQLENAFFESSNFDPVFLEQIRRALAYENVCQYCMAKGGPPDNTDEQRLSAALRFANKFAIDHKTISDNDIKELKSFFTTEEIAEFISFCSFMSASQRFGAVLGLKPASNYSSSDNKNTRK